MNAGLTAEQRMWDYSQAQRTLGRTPTGVELDRLAATNNHGWRVLRRWHLEGRIIRLAPDADRAASAVGLSSR